MTDEEIVEGMGRLTRTEGIFGETAGGVSIGVLEKMAEAGAFDRMRRSLYVAGTGLETPRRWLAR